MYPNTECHAVLALLSEGYPPLEGRSPTRYSPVCHSTHPLRDFRVRLACVRHAASVDSEPGSNSQVKFVRLRASRFGGTRVPLRCEAHRRNLFNPRSLNSLALWIQFLAPKLQLHPSTLAVVCSDSSGASSGGPFKYCPPPPRGASARQLILDGLCLHVLSSFQRTGTACHSPLHCRFGRLKANLPTI